jgi:hypothetical protein
METPLLNLIPNIIADKMSEKTDRLQMEKIEMTCVQDFAASEIKFGRYRVYYQRPGFAQCHLPCCLY